MNESTESKKHRKVVAVSTVVSLLFGVVPVFVFGHSIYVDLLDRIESLHIAAAAANARVTANEWHVRRLMDEVDHLQQIPTARADSFTGTQAQELEERLNARIKQVGKEQSVETN